MNKKLIFIPISLLAVLALVGAGCGDKTSDGTPAGEEMSLDEVLANAERIGGYNFDMVITQSNQQTMESTMWVEGANMRWEGSVEGQNVIYILNTAQQTAYIYMPSQNMAMKQSFATARGAVGESPSEATQGIPDQNPVVLGTEVWDGKTCLVVQGTSDQGDVIKWWLWTSRGIPIKTELTSHTGESIVTELRNIQVGDIADSMFELPAGVQIMDIPFGF